MIQQKEIKKEIIITEKELPLSCPKKQTWDGHPKIYLNIIEKKIVTCPYCGIIYRLNANKN